MPVGFSLNLDANPNKNLFFIRKKKSKYTKNKLKQAHSYFDIDINRSDISKNSKITYSIFKMPDLLKANTKADTHVLKIDFFELEFRQNTDNVTIGFTVNLPPVSFSNELTASSMITMDIPLDHQLHTDATILKYYFSDFTKIRERLNDFIRASSVFNMVYCKQPSIIEKEDHSLEVKWS